MMNWDSTVRWKTTSKLSNDNDGYDAFEGNNG